MSKPIKRFNIGSLLLLFITTVCSRALGADQLTIDKPEKVLRAHGVAIKEHAVAGALRSTDPEVRKAASDVLVKRWPKLALSVIERAMWKEPDGFTRVRMATDLARLGDRAGREALVKECHNTTEWGSIRIGAAAVLIEEFRDNSCLGAILDTLQSDSDARDTGPKEWALKLAPDLIDHVDPLESHKLFELVIKALGDPSPGVRTIASMMLYQIGGPAAIPGLEAAIAKEKDEDGRRMMIRELQNLQSKTQPR